MLAGPHPGQFCGNLSAAQSKNVIAVYKTKCHIQRRTEAEEGRGSFP